MELREYTNKEKMVQLSGDESQCKAAEIVAAVTAIAQERGLSEEEAYEVFLYEKSRCRSRQNTWFLRKVRSMPGCWLGVR